MQKQKFAHWEFEELLKEPDNQVCFDCGKSPAQWASVNNGVYLCINCSGNHRGYGVNISYVRSLTLDKWNDSQIGLMRVGGNKKLRELLEVYKIDKLRIDKEKLYSSKLLDFYRHVLKSKEANELSSKEAPSQEDALKSSISFYSNDNNNDDASSNNEQNKFGSIGSETTSGGDKESFSHLLNGWMTKFVDGTKNIANKVGEMEIGKKIVDTGSKISGAVLDKGTQISVRILYTNIYYIYV